MSKIETLTISSASATRFARDGGRTREIFREQFNESRELADRESSVVNAVLDRIAHFTDESYPSHPMIET